MQATEFERFVNLRGPSIYALKGAISHKAVPPTHTATDLEGIPDGLNTPIGELMSNDSWLPMIDDVWSLPDVAEEGTIIPIKTGQQFIFVKGDWYLLTGVRMNRSMRRQ